MTVHNGLAIRCHFDTECASVTYWWSHLVGLGWSVFFPVFLIAHQDAYNLLWIYIYIYYLFGHCSLGIRTLAKNGNHATEREKQKWRLCCINHTYKLPPSRLWLSIVVRGSSAGDCNTRSSNPGYTCLVKHAPVAFARLSVTWTTAEVSETRWWPADKFMHLFCETWTGQ